MAITLRGKTAENENTANSTSLTIVNTGLAISLGDCIVVSVRSGNNTANQITVSDNVNAGNYTKAVEVVDTTNGRTVGIYVMPNAAAVGAGSLTITVSSATSTTLALNGLVYIGVATSSPVDQVNSAVFSTATSSPSSGNITTTVSGDAVIGAFGLSTGATVTVSAENNGFAQEFNDTVGTAAHLHLHTADQILSGTSTLPYNPTLTGTTTGVICVASIKPLAVTVTTATDEEQVQPIIPTAQFQQELQDTFGILPPRPPFAFEDDGANMRWSDWRALQYDETDFPRSLPPTPPVSIQEEHAEQKNFDWKVPQHEDAETHRALPPTPPFAIQDEISERFVGAPPYPFIELDQPGIPIVIQAAPNIGFDEQELVRGLDRIVQYDHTPETDEPGSIPTPPAAFQDDDPQRVFNWTDYPIEEDPSTFPPVVAAIPPSSIQEEDLLWRGVTTHFVEADWSTTALPPPIAYEDDFKTFSADVRARQDEDAFVGVPPIPPLVFTASDEDLYQQKWGVTGFAALITLDEYVGVPIVTPGPFVGISGIRAFASMIGGTASYSGLIGQFKIRTSVQSSSFSSFVGMTGSVRVVPTMIYQNVDVISRGL